jgi:hypothetical protein
MSKAQGYPHKQGFNLKGFQRNKKVNAWYRKGSRNVIQQPKEKS